MQPDIGSLVLVRWLDSMAWDRWDTVDAITQHLEGLEHQTVGWLIHACERDIIVAASRHGTEPLYNGAMAIPQVAVLACEAIEA